MNIMNPNIMPICYFPTTVFLIDDEVAYTKLLESSLSSKFVVSVENNPKVALDFFNNQYKQDPFWWRALHRTDPVGGVGFGDLVFNLPELAKLIYMKDRFKQVTVAVVDYAMPGVRGDEFLQQVKTRENQGYPVIMLIMLTGQNYSPSEIQDELNAFYKKDGDMNKLFDKITTFRIIYFKNASIGIDFYLKNDPKNRTICLTDPVFINFLTNHINKNDIAEYYMADPQGSFLMLDADANLSWFLVRNDIGMKQSIQFAKQHNAPQGVIHALERRDKLLYIPDENQFQNNSIDWNDYLHPAKILDGQEKYYYALVNDLKHHNIERDKILSYNEYLAST
ncbi:MAG: hypothetical protein JSS53_08425 [Proteobacteria bacterium]|nr:hypothetical protein [Pseudomonadota bacterium]